MIEQMMDAMVMQAVGEPLSLHQLPRPKPNHGELLVRISACAVCRTDLHVADGDLKEPKLPLILGHEIVGTIAEAGPDTSQLVGTRVGIPWLGATCGACNYCQKGRENLCNDARFTGYQIDGGFAQYTVVDERFALTISDDYPDMQAAPLLCAGLIGYRSLKAAGDPARLGLYGFGAAAHIIAQLAVYQGRQVFAFTRDDDTDAQAFARELGTTWAGGSSRLPPKELDAAIIFAPVGALIPLALRAVRKGGIVVCAGIHMSDIPSFPYEILWGEREIRSVANLTRRDGLEFLELAPKVPIQTEVRSYELSEANEALNDLRGSKLRGAAVLRIG